MLGSHLSITGGLHNALIEANRLEISCVQVFTKNQRQWKAPPLTGEQVAKWQAQRAESGVRMTVSHASYLINLASGEASNREKSVALFRDEIERCEQLGIPLLVIHPGSHKGDGEAVGLARITRAIDRVHRDLPGYKTITCLESTAGQGTSLGADLGHLELLLNGVAERHRLDLCLDTCHLLAAGYDLTNAAGAAALLEEVDQRFGLASVRCWHLNDSRTPRGSRVDRHEHIGHGHVAEEAFRTLLRAPSVCRVPKILETPKATHPSGVPWDVVNLQTLARLG